MKIGKALLRESLIFVELNCNSGWGSNFLPRLSLGITNTHIPAISTRVEKDKNKWLFKSPTNM